MSSHSIDSRRARAAKSRAAVRWLGALGLVLASVVVGLMLLEIGLRALRGPQALRHWPNLVLQARIEARTGQNAEGSSGYRHDPALGFVNQPGYAAGQINFDAQGFRRMPALPADAVTAPAILATGDSYTKGDEVSDFESWPARLQDGLGWRTINAGVGAYGLDQTVLLTEQLVKRLKPAVLVVGFIADDVRRSEMSRMWGRAKPYFEPVGSGLMLRNQPVPPPPAPQQTLTAVQATFGWSVLLDTVLDRLRLRNEWHSDFQRALPSGAGERLACPLMGRIAALGVPTLVVAQYLPTAWDGPGAGSEERRVVRVVLECAQRAGLATLDVFPQFDDAIRAGGRAAVYGQWHPNAHGYRLIADAIAAELRRRDMLAGPGQQALPARRQSP
jgi:lysophospholipase L1-like esterase